MASFRYPGILIAQSDSSSHISSSYICINVRHYSYHHHCHHLVLGIIIIIIIIIYHHHHYHNHPIAPHYLAASEKVDLCANTPYVSMPSHGILCYAMLYYVMLYYNMLSRAIYLPTINTSYSLLLHDET